MQFHQTQMIRSLRDNELVKLLDAYRDLEAHYASFQTAEKLAELRADIEFVLKVMADRCLIDYLAEELSEFAA